MDKEKQERLSEVACHSATKSMFFTRLWYCTFSYTPEGSVISWLSTIVRSSLLQSFRPTTDQFVTFKYVWPALVRENRQVCLICDNLAHHGPSTEHAMFCWFCSSTVMIVKGKFWYISPWHISHKCGAGAAFCVYFQSDSQAGIWNDSCKNYVYLENCRRLVHLACTQLICFIGPVCCVDWHWRKQPTNCNRIQFESC